MHPQCITVEDALEAIDGKRAWICGTQHVLAAEVRRLRGANEGLIAEIALMGASLKKQDAEIAQLQTEKAELIKWGDGWQQQWTEMRDTMWKPAVDKLARVEIEARELSDCASQCLEMFDHDDPGTDEWAFAYQVQEAIDAVKIALRDPPPSAAPTPKGEPYNGY